MPHISLASEITHLEQAGRFDFLKFGDPDFPFDDIAAILDIDRFDFVMVGTHKQWHGITYVEVEKKDCNITVNNFRLATARRDNGG